MVRFARIAPLLMAILPLVGCGGSESPRVAPMPTVAELGRDFDPAQTGTLEGIVTWDGPTPMVPTLTIKPHQAFPLMAQKVGSVANPNTPTINPANKGLAGALVFLMHVDRSRSKKWDTAPLNIAFDKGELNLQQGEHDVLIGMVHRGEAVTAVNRGVEPHTLRCRGASFASLPLPVPNRKSERRFDRVGIVELSDAVGYIWMQRYAYVSEHPYVAVTDADGKFVLSQVPAGTYGVICWVPNWHIDRQDRDPESNVVTRLQFAAGGRQEQAAQVTAGMTTTATFAWSEKDFPEGRR